MSSNYNFSTEFAREKKIGQYLAKMWTNVCGLLFGPRCRLIALMMKIIRHDRQYSTYIHIHDIQCKRKSKKKPMLKTVKDNY